MRLLSSDWSFNIHLHAASEGAPTAHAERPARQPAPARAGARRRPDPAAHHALARGGGAARRAGRGRQRPWWRSASTRAPRRSCSARTLGADADLHLVDPFVDESGWALPAGWGASASATRRVVERAARGERSPPPLARRALAGARAALDASRSTWCSSTATTARRACARTGGAWHPHVRSGGVMAFHDASEPGSGPAQVVNELFRGERPFSGGASRTRSAALSP